MPWSIDTAHSRIGFAVRHMMIATVRGEFTQFSGEIDINEQDPSRSKSRGEIQAASIDTGNADRDAHLRGPDFFDTENHPSIRIETKRIEKASSDHYRVVGDLTIRGVTKEVAFDAELSESAKDPWGNTRRGISLTGSLSRSEFGLTWNQTLETGGFLVDDRVRIEADIEVVHASAQEAEKLAELEEQATRT